MHEQICCWQQENTLVHLCSLNKILKNWKLVLTSAIKKKKDSSCSSPSTWNCYFNIKETMQFYHNIDNKYKIYEWKPCMTNLLTQPQAGKLLACERQPRVQREELLNIRHKWGSDCKHPLPSVNVSGVIQINKRIRKVSWTPASTPCI